MIDRNRLGVILFIVSEAVFFVLLIVAYAAFHRAGGRGPDAANPLNTVKTGLFSICLFSSSLTMWQAERSRKKDRHVRVGFWLAATIALGAVFLVGQGLEYADLLRNHVTISRDLFGTTFFTLTGFHGFHVFVGLCILGILLSVAVLGRKSEPTVPAMQSVAVYWHFVDGVWVFIFAVVYLWRFL